MNTEELSADVLVVGLGPTGMTLANFLGQMGWRVVGLERDEDIYYAPRAVHFDDEIMRIFQSIGLSGEIGRTSEPFADMELLARPGAKPRLRTVIGSQDRRYGHHGAWWFHQPTLEKHLWDGLGRFPGVTAMRGVEVVAVEQDADACRVTARSADGGQVVVRSQYVVGCDGGRSFVRKAAGIKLASADFDEAWVVVDAKARCGGKDPTLPANHRQICDPRQPITYVPMAGPYYEWQFMVTGGKTEREATNPAFVRSQLKPLVDLDRIEINRIAYYKFHALWAERWRSRRIILAGDSAHQMPPFLGQGMCSGIRDAQSLAWRLDLILGGRTGVEALDDYERERSDHVGHIIRGAMFLGRVIQTRKPWLAALRNALMFWPANHSKRINRLLYETANRKQSLKRGFFGKTRRKLAGQLVPQPRILSGTTERLLDDVLGPGFAIVARQGALSGQHALIADLERNRDIAFLEIAPPHAGGKNEDVDGVLTGFMERHRVDFLILRPDRYIFDAGTEGEFAAAVAPLASALAPSQNLGRVAA